MLKQLGAASGSIRSESFGGGGPEGGPAGACIRFARTGTEAEWVPGASLLETAEAAGIEAEHECRSGSCHRCAVNVLGGEVVYFREPAVRPPSGMALVCCSRPASPELVLDL